MGRKSEFDQERVERVCRMYHANADAAKALGVSATGFGRICRRLGIETPFARQRRQRKEACHA